MNAYLILLSPFIALVLDFVAWMEACHLYDFGSDGRSDWRRPIPKYFGTYHILYRLILLSSVFLIAFIGGQQERYSALFLAMSVALFFGYVALAVLSYRRSLSHFSAQ